MNNLLKYYTRVFMLLFPVFFLPVVVDANGFGKNWFLAASALVGLVLWVIDVIVKRNAEFKMNKIFGGMLVLGVLGIFSWTRMSTSVQMSSIMNPLGLGTLLSLIIWMFLWLQVTDREEFDRQFNFLSIGGAVAALASLVVFLLPASKLPLSWPKDNPIISLTAGWSLTGSLLNEMVLLFFLVFEWVRRLLAKIKEKSLEFNYLTEAAAVGFLGLVFFLDIYKVVKLGWIVLDGASAWMIAAETFKRHPVMGIGMGNFLEAFTSFRPAAYNMTKNWATGFTGSSMGLLQIWTELGLAGLIMVAWFANLFIKQKKTLEFWRMALFAAVMMLLPLNLSVVFLLVWLAATKLFDIRQKRLFVLRVGENNFDVMPWVFSAVMLTAMGFGGYWLGRILLGDIYMRQSLVAAAKNDGTRTYNLQIKSIAANPYEADYRKMYSQTNLAIATNLLSNKDISDDDKQKAATLVQQSVREAKAAIALNPYNADYWTNLALIYKSLAGTVDGAADWSYQAYSQAVALDPINPLLKLDLGGLLYAANKYDEADRVFEQVVLSKQDFANGWYNWAYTAKKTNRLADAVSRLTQAVLLVPANSGDYDKANNELTQWRKELEELNKKLQAQATPTPEPKKAETLKTPQPLPTVGKEEKVKVPASDLQPPAVAPQTTVTPTVSPAPEATP